MRHLLLLFCIGWSVMTQAQSSGHLYLSAIPHPLTWDNTPLRYTLDPDRLVLTAGPETDMFRDPNVTYNTDNAPKLMFTADTHFVLSVRIRHAFTSKWDGGGVVLWQDSLNWVKFCFEKDYTGAHRVVTVVTRDVSDDCNSIAVKSDRVYYKIAKADHVITLYCSEDNRNWLLVRHLQFEADAPWQVGFLAQSPTGKQCEVVFSEISYRPVKIRDPYLGE
ncbi:MAG: DUF1349 domain-containing protein [Bacteroidia bacterium]|nr:DUF1349 domain-containing protein [Bacteroidia bacterium]